MLTCGIFCMFFLFYNFWKLLFFLHVDSKDYCVLWNTGYRKRASFLLSFFVLLCCLKSYWFIFILYVIIGLSWNLFFSLALICNKRQRLSMISLMFDRVLLNFSASGILGLQENDIINCLYESLWEIQIPSNVCVLCNTIRNKIFNY